MGGCTAGNEDIWRDAAVRCGIDTIEAVVGLRVSLGSVLGIRRSIVLDCSPSRFTYCRNRERSGAVDSLLPPDALRHKLRGHQIPECFVRLRAQLRGQCSVEYGITNMGRRAFPATGSLSERLRRGAQLERGWSASVRHGEPNLRRKCAFPFDSGIHDINFVRETS